jgi:hypothetical protein
MLVKAAFGEHGTYTLRRINPSRLFYRKDSPERAAAAAAGAARATTSEAAATARVVENARLPPPTTTIRSNSYGPPRCALLGRHKDKILVAGDEDKILIVDDEDDPVFRAVIYDDRSRCFPACAIA